MTPSAPLFSKLGILNIDNLYTYRVFIFMYKVYKGECPNCIFMMFNTNRQYHEHGTRQSNKYHIPLFRTNFSQRLIRYQGVIVWNSMIDDIHIAFVYKTVKRLTKRYLLKQ